MPEMEWDRIHIINNLVKGLGYKTWLEIGTAEGYCFNNVECEEKVSVDPNPLHKGCTHKMTSDEFFEKNNLLFDIVFIDGLHEGKQVFKDIMNAVKCLSPGGTIVCHDMNPLTEKAQEDIEDFKESQGMIWNGSSWKGWAHALKALPKADMFVVDCDHGCGIIKPGKAKPKAVKGSPDDYTWEQLDENRVETIKLRPEHYWENWLRKEIGEKKTKRTKIKWAVARHDDKVFNTHLQPYLRATKSPAYYATGGTVCENYNSLVQKLKPTNNDIVIFSHEDVQILDESLEEKIKAVFRWKPRTAVLGVIGTREFAATGGGWWCGNRKANGRGHLIQGMGGNPPKHMEERLTGFFDDMVSVDGCFMAVRGSFLKTFKFEDWGNHHYDANLCFQALKEGWDVSVADILIRHDSRGELPDDWDENSDRMYEHFKEMAWPLRKR